VGKDLQRLVSQFIVLKYFPKFEFIYDPSLKRGASLNDLLDDLSEEDKAK
jgi:ribosome-binding factor A